MRINVIEKYLTKLSKSGVLGEFICCKSLETSVISL